MGYWYDNVSFSILVGQTITSVRGLEKGSEEVYIETAEGGKYKMYHDQDCCESVDIEDLDGSDSDLVGGLVISAEEIEGDSGDNEYGSYTWTFYKIDTDKGGVFIRWLGESNGYYSESVSFVDLNKEH